MLDAQPISAAIVPISGALRTLTPTDAGASVDAETLSY
jgi:hypothetical protein